MRILYQITEFLSGKKSTQAKPIKDSQRNPITKEEKQIKQWADHFKRLLNRSSPATRPEIPTTARTQLQVDNNPPTRAEVFNVIKPLKAGKAAGPDGIPPETEVLNAIKLLKAGKTAGSDGIPPEASEVLNAIKLLKAGKAAEPDGIPPEALKALNAIKLLKAGKAAGPDGISPEALKADPETTVDMLTPLLQKVWKEGKVPTERGYFIHLSREHCHNYRRNGRKYQIDRKSGRRVRNTFINLKLMWKTNLRHSASTTKFGRVFNTNVKSVSSSIRIRNLEGHNEYFQKVADLY
ncbi:unnamed protein product [Trichobilharzia regenti]|nr:unnamed protein product [Trichobilharzia regenti]